MGKIIHLQTYPELMMKIRQSLLYSSDAIQPYPAIKIKYHLVIQYGIRIIKMHKNNGF